MTSDAFERQVQEYDAAMRRHDARAAAAAMWELVKISEPFVTFLKRAAWLDMRQQDYDAADAKFRTLATLTPGQPDITRALASAAIERGDIVRALIMLRELEAETHFYEDLVWLTEVYGRLGRRDLARAAIQAEA
jgi:predicted Zn-dependent protease